jgi:hypothetical protein
MHMHTSRDLRQKRRAGLTKALSACEIEGANTRKRTVIRGSSHLSEAFASARVTV